MNYKIVYLLLFTSIFTTCKQVTVKETANNKPQPNLATLAKNFKAPPPKYKPETWFHLNGNNISKEGLTLDLEAIKDAGLQGIQLFNKSGRAFPGVKPIKILSPEWEDMIRHTADECKRLGLKFTMQNCPGWSMTGGPWVPVQEAQREVVETVYNVKGKQPFNKQLTLDTLYKTPDYDYKDIYVVAFPTLPGDTLRYLNPTQVESNNKLAPWDSIFNPNSKIITTRKTTRLPLDLKLYRKKGTSKVDGNQTFVKTKFNTPTTLRSIVFPPLRHILLDKQYPRVDVTLKVEALINNKLTVITTIPFPNGNWNDRRKYLTLAVPETTSKEFVFTFGGAHNIAPEFIHLSSKPRLHNHEAKAGKVLRSLEKNKNNNHTVNTLIKPNTIIDLTDKMGVNGQLNWLIPEGHWTIVRFGHINMRLKNKPAVPEATGWESSKLDKIAIENHLRKGMIGNLIKDGGPIGDGKLHGLLIDSWESHVPTWTINSQDFFKAFKQRRGYSMKPYMLATMGYVVESTKTTTKFLRDLRATKDEVFVDNFFKHFATIAHDMGAEVYTEGAGGEVLPIDPMRYYGVSDIPMTEFWHPKSPSAQNEYAKPIYSAASATHLYNKPILAAEACTQLGVTWSEHPFSVKSLIDYNFTKGVNHLVFHTFSHTPQTNVYPGSSFGGNIGFPFVREQTWWPYMKDWTNYLSRNQYMLQQGEYVADVLRYYGDHFERPPFDLDYFPKGYRFDYLNNEILTTKLSVVNGKIHVKDAGNYRLITLRDSKEILLSTIKKLKELVLNGAVILGDKPLDSPSLMDNEKDLLTLSSIANQLWGDTEKGVKKVGKGKVYWGMTVDQVLKAEQITPDVIVPKELDIKWIHRETPDAHIYYIASRSDKPVDAALSFRITGHSPQLWNAFNGETKDINIWSNTNGRTNIALSFAPSDSHIIVFTKENKKPLASKVEHNNHVILNTKLGWFKTHDQSNYKGISWANKNMITSKPGEYKFYTKNNLVKSHTITVKETELSKDWNLEFELGWDTPQFMTLNSLKSLTALDNVFVKHYSGTVSYKKTFNILKANKHYMLDLGEVANIAELWLNGEKIDVKWAPPFVFDVSKAIKTGKNTLEVKVTNTWRNQLIMDKSRTKANKKTWTTNPPKKHDTLLDKSGLIGPVVLSGLN